MEKIESGKSLPAIVGKKLHAVNIRDISMHTFYALADGLDNVSNKIHQKYVEYGFRDAEMHLAVQQRDKRAVVGLLVDGVDPSAPSGGTKWVTPLMIAMENHDHDNTNILLNATYRRDPARILSPSPLTGETLAHIAAKHSNWTAFESLIRFHPDLNLADATGMSPINLVAQNGTAKILADTLAKGGDPQTLDNTEMPVAFHVLIGTSPEKVEMLELLRAAGANLTGKFGPDRTSLLSIAAQFCEGDVVDYLRLLPGMDINSINDQGLTPLHFSGLNKNPGITARLLLDNAQPNVLSNADSDKGYVAATPLMIAAANNNLEAAVALMDDPRTNLMVKVPGTKDEALSIAAARGNDEIVQLLQVAVRERVNAATLDSTFSRLSIAARNKSRTPS